MLWNFRCVDTFIANYTRHSHASEADSHSAGQVFYGIRKAAAVFNPASRSYPESAESSPYHHNP